GNGDGSDYRKEEDSREHIKKLKGAASMINTCADNFIPIAPWRESSAFSGESRLVAAKLFGDCVETLVRAIQGKRRLTACPRLEIRPNDERLLFLAAGGPGHALRGRQGAEIAVDASQIALIQLLEVAPRHG